MFCILKRVEAPADVFEESPQYRRAPPLVRVEKMLEEMQSRLPGQPKFLLCLIPERKNCVIYGLCDKFVFFGFWFPFLLVHQMHSVFMT